MRALIVDDEARVRKAVRLLVDWREHGIEDIAEAGGGLEAIGVIREFKPAIVIMDMMMNAGHGMELMAWVNEHAPSLKFIVISGHDDFEFVRGTVRHGGIDYILKPIEPEAINAAVAKAVRQWRQEERERLDQQSKSIRLNEIRPIYGEKLLSSMIDDPGSADNSLKRLRMEGVIPTEADQARLLLIQVDASDTSLLRRFGNDGELLQFSLINICNDFLIADQRGIAFKHWGAAMEILILVWKQPERAAELVGKINDGLFHTLQRRIHVGLASPGPLPSSLPAQYAEASAAIRRRNLLQPDQYLHALKQGQHASESQHVSEGPRVPEGVRLSGGLRMSEGVRVSEDEPVSLSFAGFQADFKTAVLSGDPGQIASSAQQWIDALTRSGYVSPELLESWKSSIISFRSGLLREVLGSEADQVLPALEQGDQAEASPVPNGYAFSPFAWRDWLIGFLTRLAGEVSKRQQRESRKIGDILAYIEQHYQSELSLQDLASHFQVSREYISRKFKQEFGDNFSDYLAAYRIDKAKKLMRNPNLKVQRIAEMVGFNDVKYFSKVFKKQEGLSPREYRSKWTDQP
ncbi:helix-turn-helix domain-containing protein [Paenibacillus sp. alder61]|uniref:response regulator transcription factor n=1 Tax=Paenibacillus sp. alder61 TaxID=2862948 RepID=UPI001CD7A8A1|nr:helix-turn-helix domain-containing protein [Paenibacillus sp. alder61]MCA1296491.1 helix-turn-helix domain-containing protein [Paenibacillus sp. alder61]